MLNTESCIIFGPLNTDAATPLSPPQTAAAKKLLL